MTDECIRAAENTLCIGEMANSTAYEKIKKLASRIIKAFASGG